MKVISSYNVPEAYCFALQQMRVWAEDSEETRHGPARVARHVLLEIWEPEQRVLFDPVRNANPFFHVAEFVWMMSGSNDVRWIEQFNSRMREYADEGSNIHHGAYGYRWRNHFNVDQLVEVRDLLRRTPNTRRAVLCMWDPTYDLEDHNDLPCNTHIYFDIQHGELNMTVCNRSNDLIWGMLGANAVHMTLLMELLARDLKLEVGIYRVFTNNLHVYESLPNFGKIWNTKFSYNPYGAGEVSPYPILDGIDNLESFLQGCEDVIKWRISPVKWLLKVATPMIETYMERRRGRDGRLCVGDVQASDWRKAANDYIERKELARSTLIG